MDTTSWKTHCFGRYLLDLPPDARIIQRYEIWSNEIQRLEGDIAAGKAQMEAREKALKAEKHETAGSMFIRRIALANDSVGLLSYNLTFDTSAWRMYTYLVAGGKEPRIYLYNTLVSLRLEKTAIAFFQSLSQNIHALASGEIPNGQGFCIDGAFIVGNEHRSESFRVSIELATHPGLDIEFAGSTRGKTIEEGLLERVDNWANGIIQSANGLKTLRKGKHDVGSLRADEYLVRGHEQGHQLYTFLWEAPGKASSVAEPRLTAGFNGSPMMRKMSRRLFRRLNRTRKHCSCGMRSSIPSAHVPVRQMRHRLVRRNLYPTTRARRRRPSSMRWKIFFIRRLQDVSSL
jgi:hypothetical protein